jgi:hypothetical protein
VLLASPPVTAARTMKNPFSSLALSAFSSVLCTLGCAPDHAPQQPNPAAGAWTAPQTPPAAVAPPAQAPARALAAPTRALASAPAPVPAGWVNYGGLILPAIPGLTTSATGTSLNGTAASAPGPNGWVTIGGITVPAIPGLTVPVTNTVPTTPTPTALVGRCGAVTVAGHRIPIDCITPSYAQIASASQLTMSRGMFNSGKGFVGAAALPTTVDHRADGTEGPIRDQQEVGDCSAFSLAAAIDHAFAKLTGRVAAVSVMHTWSHYHDPSMSEAADDNRGRVLTQEAAWAYDENVACSWDCQDSCHDDLHVACATPDPVMEGAADAKELVKLSNVTRLDITNLDSFKDALAEGQDIWFGMNVDPLSLSSVSGPDAVIPDGTFRNGQGHAMVLAGYNVQANGTYYLIHNSWSENWGDRGFAWIHETTLKNNLVAAYLVDVTVPNSTQPAPTPAPAPPPAACPSGSKPDSGTGVCAATCSDGSPRNNNACPVANQCPAGYVNLSGQCVIAAPVIAGQDAKTGIVYTCSSGGCAYGIPYGQAGCALPYCAKSCPAPQFHLTTGASGAGCSE